MTAPSEVPGELTAIRRAAAGWVVRRARGLSAVEQDAFLQWLATDERHRAALAERHWTWEALDRLAGVQTAVSAVPDPDLLALRRAAFWRGSRRAADRWRVVAFAAAATCIVIAALRWEQVPDENPAVRTPSPAPLSTALAAPCEKRTLADGSVVEMNRGALLTIEYRHDRRQVQLERGEANFIITPDAARPFVVRVGPVTARALGTTFNVRRTDTEVEIIVTEGRVQLEVLSTSSPLPILTAKQRAVVPLETAANDIPLVGTLTATEMGARLAWQPRLLTFTDTPLREIVADFNRRNAVELVIASPALQSLGLNGTFRSDNVEGFLRLMESDFNMSAEWSNDRTILLRQKN